MASKKKNSGSSRGVGVRVKTAKKRSTSSTRWLQRQLNDPYVQRAKREGYRSRAAFKLLDLDAKFHLLHPGDKVVDLGCAPGGWAQVAVAKVGAKGKVIGVDLLEVDPVAGADLFVLDFLANDAPEIIKARLNGHANLVLSDMAANTTGHAPTDHIRIIHLCELAYQFATEILAPGGAFVCKVLKGGTERELLKKMQRDFASVKHAKPASSRADSAESYVVATGFRKIS
ncbi:MAG: RlmE family RNA methyltransferase [Alphaproteobacteria bacterium]|jgi:23S rRNA (uridine2552-2'-O)-methyltransferase